MANAMIEARDDLEKAIRNLIVDYERQFPALVITRINVELRRTQGIDRSVIPMLAPIVSVEVELK